MSMELLQYGMENERMRDALMDLDAILKSRLLKAAKAMKAGREPTEFVDELADAREALRTIDDALALGADLCPLDADGFDDKEE